MSVKENANIRPDYVQVFTNHPAYGLLVRLRELEMRLVRAETERDEWKQAFEHLSERYRRKYGRAACKKKK